MINFEDPVYNLPLTTTKQVEALNKLGIYTLRDLVYHFPRTYLDTRNVVSIDQWDGINLKTSLIKVIDNKVFRTKGGKIIITTIVEDEDNIKAEIMWFNQPFILKIFEINQYYLIFGKLNKNSTYSKRRLEISEYEKLYDGRGSRHLDKITAIYPETKGISSKWIRSKVSNIFKTMDITSQQLHDPFQSSYLDKYDLLSLTKALKYIHIPENFKQIDIAKKRLGFDELFELFKKVIEIKREKEKIPSLQMKPYVNGILSTPNNFVKNINKKLELSFELTSSQKECIEEIIQEISSKKPMSRLLHGDTGSGKTVVATAISVCIMENQKDVVLLCPTTVLAEQHYKSISNFLKGKNFDVKLITGGKNKKYDEITSNRPIIYIGTHALLFKQTEIFKNIGLVIVDEQHRFGVEQREKLIEDIVRLNGNIHTPHYLMLTATPIPRSIAQIYFADLKVSYISAPPKNRKPIQTFVVNEDKRKDSYNWIKNKLRDGEQAYIICPLIETSEKLNLKSVILEHEKIQEEFPEFKIALLHGKMKASEKTQILNEFRDKKSDILVSTQVIEVGVDVPNTTVIIIESAERFGLAGLHQLRGRVGRGDKQSYCLLYLSPPSENVLDEKVDKSKSLERLQYFSNHNDGMELSEYDMLNRGIGNLVGNEQTGLPKFKIANIGDIELINLVKQVGKDLGIYS